MILIIKYVMMTLINLFFMAAKAAKLAKRAKQKIVKKYDDKVVLPVKFFEGGKGKMYAYYEKGDVMVTDENGRYVKYQDIPSFSM